MLNNKKAELEVNGYKYSAGRFFGPIWVFLVTPFAMYGVLNDYFYMPFMLKCLACFIIGLIFTSGIIQVVLSSREIRLSSQSILIRNFFIPDKIVYVSNIQMIEADGVNDGFYTHRLKIILLDSKEINIDIGHLKEKDELISKLKRVIK